MDYRSAKTHLGRLQHQAGKPLRLGPRAYRLRGYFGNRMARDFAHEPHLLAVLKRRLDRHPGTFVDVGTNVGQTLVKVLALDPTRRYVGFEPQIACCFFIDQFVRDNQLANVSIVATALSNENRVCVLYSNNAYDEMASLVGVADTTGANRSVTALVPVRVGDEVLAELEVTDASVIKVDVEGAELKVFEGLSRTLQEQRPSAIFEVLPNFHGHERTRLDEAASERNRAAAGELLRFFREAGYQVSQVHADGSEHVIEAFDLDNRDRFLGSDYVAEPVIR